jgi:hypothetical protein
MTRSVPNDAMLLALAQTRDRLAAALSDTFGAYVATSFAQRFVVAVAGHKREIDRAAAVGGDHNATGGN